MTFEWVKVTVKCDHEDQTPFVEYSSAFVGVCSRVNKMYVRQTQRRAFLTHFLF